MAFDFTAAEAALLIDVVAHARTARRRGEPPGTLEAAVRAEYRRTHGLGDRRDLDLERLLARLAPLDAAGVRELQRACLRGLALRIERPPEYRRDGEPWLHRACGLVAHAPAPAGVTPL